MLVPKTTYKFIVFLTLLVTAGCAKTTVTTQESNNSETSPIQVFYSTPTDRKYTELGLVTTQTGQTIFHDKSAEGMIEKLKEEAIKIGADAIIVRSANEGTWGTKGGGTTGFERGNAQAIAIKFQ